MRYRLGVCAAAILALLMLATGVQADGYIIPLEEPSSSVMADQKAVIVYRDGREDLIISAGLALDMAQDLAWIIPVPSVPEVQVTGQDVFAALDRISAPEVVYRSEDRPGISLPFFGTGAEAPLAPPVEVIERRQVDVYDVAVLAAGDAQGLLAWLDTEGFVVPDDLGPALDAYVADGWSFVALRLAPGTEAGALMEARPVWLSFAANGPVYPMRLTAAVNRPLAVRLYVLTDHRYEMEGFEVEYAGWLEPGADEALAVLIDRPFFFTKLFDAAVGPEEMGTDFYPRQAAADESLRQQTVYTYVSASPNVGLGELGCLCGLCGGGGLIVLVLVIIGVRALRRRRHG